MQVFNQVLRNDKYCRSIDLRNNLLPQLDEEFFGCLYSNENVVSVDFRDNTKIDQD